MASSTTMFILLIVFVILTIGSVMYLMRHTEDEGKNNEPTKTSSSREVFTEPANVVQNMNRTYDRFYWGNNEL